MFKFLFTFFFIIILIVSFVNFSDQAPMDYDIQTSTIPQNQLWSIYKAKDILKKSYFIGIPVVLDEKELLELVKHAYQWDKNAMIVYAQIVEAEYVSPPEIYSESFSYFLKKYHNQIVDQKGHILTKPKVLNFIDNGLNFQDFIKILADKKYVIPSSYMVQWMRWYPGTAIKQIKNNNNEIITDNIYNPLSNEQSTDLLKYIQYSQEGGFRYYEMYADIILFKSAFSFKDEDNKVLNKVSDFTYSEIEKDMLLQAVKSYQVCANHGSQYCMTRLSEIYYYGIGVEQNYPKAYVWAILSQEAYKKYIANKKLRTTDNDDINKIINHYNLELKTLLIHKLSIEELANIELLIENVKKNIVTWDYDNWLIKDDFVSPQP